MKTLVVIPTLNEAEHIAQTIHGLRGFVARHPALVVVVDGGSQDSTRATVKRMKRSRPWLHLLDNPERYQSAGINRAVAQYGNDCELLIRIDAHADYPADFCDILVAEAEAQSADSVVVSMRAVGKTPLQKLIAEAQNSRFGNGSAAHRNASDGRWVDHGHHALMRLPVFNIVGGYDPSFSHNEDAELDYRLRLAGHSIWLTAKTEMEYHPRQSIKPLMRQYFFFGQGRARNFAKHHARPGARQCLVMALVPALLLTVFVPFSAVFIWPLLAWVLGCLVAGLSLAIAHKNHRSLATGFLAGLMQVSWSAGYWVQVLRQRFTPSRGI